MGKIGAAGLSYLLSGTQTGTTAADTGWLFLTVNRVPYDPMCHPSTPGCLPIERRTYAHAKPAQTEAPSPNVHPRGADKQVWPIHSREVCSARGVTAAKGTRRVRLKRETPTRRDYPRCGCVHFRWQSAAWQLRREAGGGEIPQKETRGSLGGWGKP